MSPRAPWYGVDTAVRHWSDFRPWLPATRSRRSSRSCGATLDVGRCTLRQPLPGDVYLPVTHEVLAGGAPVIADDTSVDLRTQPVPRRLAAGERQVVQEDCRAASDEPAFHAMLERYGGMRAQVVTGIHDGDGEPGRRSSPCTSCERRGPGAPPSSRVIDAAADRDPEGTRVTVHELLPPIRRPLAEWPQQGHNRWHPDLPPAIEVEPGDEVVVDCRDGLDGLVTPTTTDADLLGLELAPRPPDDGPDRRHGGAAGRRAAGGDPRHRLRRLRRDGGHPGLRPAGGRVPRSVPRHLGPARRRRHERAHARHPRAGRPVPRRASASPRRRSAWRPSRRARRHIVGRGGVALPPEPGGAVPADEPFASSALRTIPPRETGGNLDVRDARAGRGAVLPRRRRGRASSRWATCTSRRATARSAAPRSRRTPACG